MFYELRSAFREAGCVEKSVSPVGLFIVRRTMSVSDVVKSAMTAVLTDNPVIESNGIKIHRPHAISILMTDMRKWDFTPAFPVSAQLLGMDVSVDVKSIELVKDSESGNPAVLFTTTSSLRPDVMLICETGNSKPDTKPDSADNVRLAETERLLALRAVPQKYHAAVRQSIVTAWATGTAQSCIVRGLQVGSDGITIEESEAVAEMIVNDMIAKKQIAGVGWFFWFQLGYWLIRIIAELIRGNK